MKIYQELLVEGLIFSSKKSGLHITVKNLRLYPSYKLTSYPTSFMDVGERHKTPRSETKNFINQGSSSSQFCDSSVSLQFPQGDTERAR